MEARIGPTLPHGPDTTILIGREYGAGRPGGGKPGGKRSTSSEWLNNGVIVAMANNQRPVAALGSSIPGDNQEITVTARCLRQLRDKH